jgi:hypothetical protein
MWVMTFDLKRLWRWSLPVGVTGGLLLAFWALPYEYRLPYATNMGYGKITAYLSALSPRGDLWLLILAGLGAFLSIVGRNRVGTFLLIMTFGAAVTFRFGPSARLWNARWLPFWFLGLYLLAGVAFAETGTIVAALARRRARGWSLAPVPIVALLVALVWVGLPLQILPFGHLNAKTKAYHWMGISTTDHSYIPDWVRWDYSGYQSTDKSSRAAYFALIAEMDKLGHTTGDGCGRVMYQYEPALNDMGTSDALMLLPYWTDGCIATIEGLYYESSATTPYHFLNSAELSPLASNPMRNLAYPDDLGIADGTQLAEGIAHLQILGVKYFIAVTPSVQRQAAADKSLRYLTEVGPYPTHVTNAAKRAVVENQTWKIYKILDAPLVEPLANQPVVMRDTAGTNWLGQLTSAAGTPTARYSPTESWYLDPRRWDVYETSSGPSSWARVPATDSHPPKTPEPKAQVTHIVENEQSISFDVDRTGVPILVKISYFPNWHVSGAKHIYRVTPNLMVVVPTSTHVSLTYRYTPIDWAGLLLSLFGVVAVAALWKRKAVAFSPRS